MLFSIEFGFDYTRYDPRNVLNTLKTILGKSDSNSKLTDSQVPEKRKEETKGYD